ncbi:GTP-binding protein [Kineosporia succinea]|uniref:Signal recognition particle receptor subunit beta n=1 Tax=Kineosporia succinea TaxID=84632 RepID=A0ABT9P455_9ACTN|nr:ATP/GTP-binding protein [Kineosporia succinea]MDP9826980.1 signal recognition particle receptor subunit beta [Kineosporia succinea]
MSLHSETRSSGGLEPAGGGGKRPPIPVKILISGGFGVGKTTTVGALSEIDPLSTEAPMTSASIGVDDAGTGSQKTTTTVAMDFGRITIDESIILYMFGTPGQDRFGFMWNDLADGALGGVVLVDPSRMEDCFVALDYFENIRLPYVVAVNHFAGRPSLTLEQVRHAVNVDPDVPVVSVDARDREQVKAVVLTLLRRILARAKSRSRG